jgi:hypothetical protein
VSTPQGPAHAISGRHPRTSVGRCTTTDAHWSKPRHPCGRFYPHGHPPERLNDEITADYNDMIYAATREEIEARRKAFIRK